VKARDFIFYPVGLYAALTDFELSAINDVHSADGDAL
jgi:hypothetical protein